jgi:hypothetical protein
MYVYVRDDLTITLEDRDDFSSLSVVYASKAQQHVGHALRSAGAGHLVGADQAAVTPEWLRGYASEGSWREHCDTMIAKASSAGWVQADGSVLAHLAPE